MRASANDSSPDKLRTRRKMNGSPAHKAGDRVFEVARLVCDFESRRRDEAAPQASCERSDIADERQLRNDRRRRPLAREIEFKRRALGGE